MKNDLVEHAVSVANYNFSAGYIKFSDISFYDTFMNNHINRYRLLYQEVEDAMDNDLAENTKDELYSELKQIARWSIEYAARLKAKDYKQQR